MSEDNIIVYKTVCNNNYKRNFAVCRTERKVPPQTERKVPPQTERKVPPQTERKVPPQTERKVPSQTQSHCKTCVSSNRRLSMHIASCDCNTHYKA